MIYPMFIMVLLTLSIGCFAFSARVKSVKTGLVHAKTYKLMDSDTYPDDVIKTTRNFNNQFEIPVLFYVGCLSYIALDINSALGLVFAWAFVILRIIHSIIHITYNKLIHRIVVFWLACFMVLGLWLTILAHNF